MAGSSLFPKGVEVPTDIGWKDYPTKSFTGLPEWQSHLIMLPQKEMVRIFGMERIPYGQKREPILNADGSPVLDASGNPTFRIVRDERLPAKIAPLGPEFENVAKGVKAGLQKRAESDTYKIARKEMDRARYSDIYDAALPHLEKASTEPTEYIEGYLNRFKKNMMQPLLDEAGDYFMNKISPNINNRYAAKGAWYSGARHKSLQNAKIDLHKNTLREAKKMMFEAERGSHDYLHKHHGRHLSSAQLAADTVAREKEARMTSANMMSNLAGREQAQEMIDQEAMRGIGQTREDYEQRKINELVKEHDISTTEAERRLSILINSTRGHNVGTSAATASLPPPPRAPNPTTQGISALQQIQSRGAYGFKKGGHIKTKYANGGHVSPTFPQYHDSQLPAFNTPEMQEIREIGAHLKHGHGNPSLSAMGASGAAMGMAGPHVSPFQAFSYGTAKGREAYHDIHEANLVNKQRAANLIEKINDSRLEQHKILATYEQKQKEFAEDQRLRSAQIEVHKEHANLYRQQADMLPQKAGKFSLTNPIGGNLEDKRRSKIFEKHEERDLKEAQEGASAAKNVLETVTKMQQLLPSIGSTGQYAGMLPDALATALSGNKADRQVFDSYSKKLLSAITSTQKGAQSDADMVVWGKTVAGLDKEAKANEMILADNIKLAHRAQEYEDFMEDAFIKGIPTSIAKKQFKKYANENPILAKNDDYTDTNYTNEEILQVLEN